MKVGGYLTVNDELRIYRGEDYYVAKHITIHQPTLNEICIYGEREYYQMIYQLTSTPQSMKWQLWDMGIDYTTITPFELFCILYQQYSVDKTSIIFGNLDFSKFKIGEKNKDDNNFTELYQVIDGDLVEIDETIYNTIMDYIRSAHLIKKDETIPANESTKKILIEDDREEYLYNQNKEYHSQLKNMISAMINCEGFKYNHTQVWDMKINAFMDSVQRISKIKNADLLLQSGYSGFGINLKEIDKKQLDWLGELN